MNLKLIENGPIVLDTEGQVGVSTGGSSEQKTGPLFLCRCGASASKPFCDGSHRKTNFQGPGGELQVE